MNLECPSKTVISIQARELVEVLFHIFVKALSRLALEALNGKNFLGFIPHSRPSMGMSFKKALFKMT